MLTEADGLPGQVAMSPTGMTANATSTAKSVWLPWALERVAHLADVGASSLGDQEVDGRVALLGIVSGLNRTSTRASQVGSGTAGSHGPVVETGPSSNNYRTRTLFYANKPNWNVLNTLTPTRKAKRQISRRSIC
ncbi:MAG: hypothetical protein KTU85_12955 [Acidimicrobiia bacterium]|nr:hypothetical protein [Acidimicrobiia bacterium]